MLKIKDNIDLDELEKLGYKEREDKWMGLCYYKSFSNPKYEDEEYAGISIVNCRETRSIGFDLEISIGNLDKMTLNYYIGKYEDELYELTSRNMVERWWKMSKIYHCCLSIEGSIRNAKDLKGCITVDGKVLMTVKEIRDFMKSQLALGRKVLPCGDCDNFDYQTGCKGHEVEYE